jgi:cytidylate kinase
MALITISRGIGCGGMIISRRVADGLKLELYDDEKLQHEAIRMGIKPEAIKDMDEKAPGFFDLILNKRPEIYLDYMEAVVYEVAKTGKGVIVGHGSQVLLRDFECALHVRIHANEATRVQNLMKHRGVSEAAARRLIHKRDQEQRGFFRFAFHMDWNDPSLYDLIINTEQLGIDLAARLIMEAAVSEQIKACSLKAIEAMDRLSFKKRVHAALLEADVNVSNLYFDVPEKGVVEINGFTETKDQKKRIQEKLKALSGVSKIEDHIVVLSAHRGY